MATRFDITRRDLMKTSAATALVMTPNIATPPELSGIHRIPLQMTLSFNVSHAKQVSAAVPPQTVSSQSQ